eukprot:CAMPEP_0177504652 /NCGR_PEP_ID=MMETSP0369-20130122/38978_1 /TAXON_ID=447022 ORGANISM="Scrippsiella hangoei-like, Strain SHHI-4" /NCGR_SAMPLE_ID=MMETSP0369 /ASSEMBLY_ACC=CAM_ASM_000364 /LENGTH=56 /DNA_ID=CAMNT_0018982451 /DNA_START=62 /DNA_END=229 /DNA_ORIENTATION=-
MACGLLPLRARRRQTKAVGVGAIPADRSAACLTKTAYMSRLPQGSQALTDAVWELV